VRLRFRPEARLDILEARQWYESRTAGLGSEFARSVDAAAAGILRFPESHPQVHGDVRKAILRRFPYSLLYVTKEGEITVFACFHHRRDPHTWSDRL
jgi:plasmid stabilization system protein ParE